MSYGQDNTRRERGGGRVPQQPPQQNPTKTTTQKIKQITNNLCQTLSKKDR
ncbi:MAG: hypothetical protein ACRCTJ_03730 [Brevinema sp.]